MFRENKNSKRNDPSHFRKQIFFFRGINFYKNFPRVKNSSRNILLNFCVFRQFTNIYNNGGKY